ncbi:MAG: hypothetical protein SGILL_004476 [Bacillariaceae sp.]
MTSSERVDQGIAAFKKKKQQSERQSDPTCTLDNTDTTWPATSYASSSHQTSSFNPPSFEQAPSDFGAFNPFGLSDGDDDNDDHDDNDHQQQKHQSQVRYNNQDNDNENDNTNDDPSKKTLQDILTKLEEHHEQQRLMREDDEKDDPFFTAGDTTSQFSNSGHTNTTRASTVVDLDSVLDLYDVKLMIAQVVDCMASSEDSPEIQTDGAEALHQLAVAMLNEFEDDDDDENDCQKQNSLNASQHQDSPESMTTTGVEAILQAMEDFPDEETLQEKSCSALEYLTYYKINQELILTRGRVEEILVAMEEFVDNISLQTSAMGVLQNLAKHPYSLQDKNTAQQLAHAMPLILELMKEYRENEDVYLQGCGALSAITYNSNNSQQLLCKDQIGIRIVIEAMHKFSKSSNLKIQLHAMETLEHVASHPSPECKGKIVLQGGLERILDALQRNNIVSTSISSYEDEIEQAPSQDGENKKKKTEDVSTLIIVSALQTLANIADVSNPASTISDETKKRMAKAVKVILNVLRQHPRNSLIQVAGFTALKMLAGLHTELLCSCGGISTILVAMLEQPTDTELQKQACSTLNNLLSSPYAGDNSLDLVLSISTEDGLTILFQSEAAFGVLYYLSCNRDIPASQKRLMCQEENIFVLLATMNQMLESEILCEKACGLILNLSFFAPISQDVMASVGGIRIILAAMRRHGLNTQIQECGAGILSGLCLDDKNHAEFVNEEGISTVLAAMMIHPAVPSIQACSCDVLAHLALSNTLYRRSIVDGNGPMVANDAITRHRGHKGVQTRASELLRALQ